MGWSLELFLKKFVILDWISKEQAGYIKDNMNAPTCLLLSKFSHKFTCDENKIQELEEKLKVAVEALFQISENDDNVCLHSDDAKEALKKVGEV